MPHDAVEHADSTYDVAVIGGGAAGLSGATVLGRLRRSVIVSDLTAQVVSAAASGLMAGAVINFDLIAEETADAVTAHRDRLSARADLVLVSAG